MVAKCHFATLLPQRCGPFHIGVCAMLVAITFKRQKLVSHFNGILMSSTINLCLKLCPWAKFRKAKGGVKMHTLLDLRGNLPVSVYLTEASVNDVKVLDDLYIEPSAIYLMDREYVDYNRLFKLIHKKQAFFVTRIKDKTLFEVTSSITVDKSIGVIADERIKLTGARTAIWYPEELRMVTYEDYANNVVYRFITNNTEYDPLTIAELYRERWNIELFFKWIKQHLHIKSFYGTSQNAVYLQIWIAVCTYLILAYAKKKYCIEQSLHTISKNVGLSLTDKTPINKLFSNQFHKKNQAMRVRFLSIPIWAYLDCMISKRDSSGFD